MTGLFAHAVPDGLHRRRVDGRGRARSPTRPTSTRSTSTSRRVAFANEHLERLGRDRRRPRPAAARARRAVRGEPLGPGRARRRRALGRPPRVPAPRRPRPARGERDRRRAPPRRGVPRRRGAAPARALADAGAICVLGTDLNPGTSPVASIPAILGLAVRRYGWSVREALLACTLNAAYVLGLSGEVGSLEDGKRADVIVLDTPGRPPALPLRPQPGVRRPHRRPPGVGAAGQRVAPGGRRSRDAARRARPGDGQRPLARLPARPARHRRAARPARTTTSGPGAPRCSASRARSSPTRCATSRARVYGEMAAAGYGAVGEFHYVHHRPDGTPYETRTRWRSRSPRRRSRPACGSCSSPPPTTATAGTAPTARPSPASGASATPTSRPSSRASTTCARGPRTATA